MKKKILFIHEPGRRNIEKPATVNCAMAIPAGVFALSAAAHKKSWVSEIAHTGVEGTGGGSVVALAAEGHDVFAYDLHWHAQISAVLASSKIAKQLSPKSAVLIGGITASYFYKEIMEKCLWVDFVIRGDAEIPLEGLLDKLEAAGGDFSTVPNLSWRRGGRVVHNEQSYIASAESISQLDYTGISRLRNHGQYSGAIEFPAPDLHVGHLWGRPRTHHIVPGRGCPGLCGYCGGSANGTKKVFKRTGTIFRSRSGVIAEMKAAAELGFEAFYFCFNPPGSGEYYRELFEEVAQGGGFNDAAFEYYDGLPDGSFLRSFSGAFKTASIVFSPGTASKKIRSANRMIKYTNAELENCLKEVRAAGINAQLYFALFPQDDMAALKKTAAWMRKLKSVYGAAIEYVPIEIEPGSDWHSDPGKFGMTAHRKSFKQFLSRHASATSQSSLSYLLGYEIPDEERVSDFLIKEIMPITSNQS